MPCRYVESDSLMHENDILHHQNTLNDSLISPSEPHIIAYFICMRRLPVVPAFGKCRCKICWMLNTANLALLPLRAASIFLLLWYILGLNVSKCLFCEFCDVTKSSSTCNRLSRQHGSWRRGWDGLMHEYSGRCLLSAAVHECLGSPLRTGVQIIIIRRSTSRVATADEQDILEEVW